PFADGAGTAWQGARPFADGGCRARACQPPPRGVSYLENELRPLFLPRIRDSGYHRAQIAEFRGPFGPKGARVYRVLVQRKPRMSIEVLEDQLEVLNGA